MSARPSVPDPAEISFQLWRGFGGKEGWDVGGNCGQTILDMVWSFDHVTSFEPSPDSFEAAQLTVRTHHLNASLLNIALSDRDGELILAYPAQEQKETGQLVTIGTRGMEWEPEDWEAPELEKVTVACRKADSVAAERDIPDFMKVDTEGHELHVLLGAQQILARGKTDILLEFHTPQNHQACQVMLETFDYAVEVVRHPHYAPESHMWHQHGWLRAFAPNGRKHA